MKDTLLVSLKKYFREETRSKVAGIAGLFIIGLVMFGGTPAKVMVSPTNSQQLQPIASSAQVKSSHEVFGFAPYWNIDKLSNVDFKTLTTFAYFGVDVDGNGNLDKNSAEYETFKSRKATELFQKAHENGTRVVLTLTQMNNNSILELVDNPDAQQQAIDDAVEVVKNRGIDGINVDFEFNGDPGQYYRGRFTEFVSNMTSKMHEAVPGSKVTVSVYASAVKDPKIYDIEALGRVSDGIFMMAYDFAVASSDNAIPTAPLNGHENGKYWYDIATAVNDFLRHIPSEKLILGVPYYGYNYTVSQPTVKAPTGTAVSNTYSVVQDSFGNNNNLSNVDEVIQGWDDDGKVGYYAYRIASSGVWRMIFMEDTKSLGLKYDFAKDKKLAGVGIWALGNDHGRSELWDLLKEKFGAKEIAANDLSKKEVKEIYD